MSRRRARLAALGVLAAAAGVGCGGEEPAPPPAPHVLVFVLDAARADRLGSYGHDRPTTPRIDAFARDAVVYRQAVADAAYTWASVAALFTGAPPGATGLLRPRRLEHPQPLLAEVARAHGYRTWAYSENPHITRRLGFAAGFDRFREELPVDGGPRGGVLPVDAEPGIRATLDFLRQPSDQPFFAYVQVLRPHNPYRPPPPFLGRLGSDPAFGEDGVGPELVAMDDGELEPSPERLANLVTLYEENLAYGDFLFGMLHDGLRAAGLLERTAVVVTSDHGEAFLEHGRMLHSSTVYEEMIRIPLVVRVPGVPARVSRASVQLSDLGAALRHVVEGREPPAVLAQLERARPAVAWTVRGQRRAAVRSETHKLVIDLSRRSPVALYDLRADPGERTPLRDAVREAALMDVFRAEVGDRKPWEATRSGAAIDPETRERLRALGYLDE